MQWYPWLTPYYKLAVSQYLVQRAHPAIIIQAHAGMGSAALVWGLSRWLLCNQRQGNKSCGECHACKLMLAHNHPDWYSLSAEKGKHTISIDAVRAVSDKIWHSAQQGGARVVWIDNAQQLSEAAANALLKTIEEPPENCWLLLTTPTLSSLPATLRSRCIMLTLTAPQEAQSINWLAKEVTRPTVELQTALRLSAGAPAAALTLLNSSRWQARLRLGELLLTHLPKQPMQLLPQLLQEDVGENIHWLMSYLLDALKYRQGAADWLTHVDNPAVAHAISRLFTADQLLEQLKLWRECRYTLEKTPQVNQELLVTQSLLAWEAAVI